MKNADLEVIEDVVELDEEVFVELVSGSVVDHMKNADKSKCVIYLTHAPKILCYLGNTYLLDKQEHTGEYRYVLTDSCDAVRSVCKDLAPNLY